MGQVCHQPLDTQPPAKAACRCVLASSCFPGADGSELGRIERFVAKRFIPEGDWRDWPSIEAWARSIALDLKSTQIGAL